MTGGYDLHAVLTHCQVKNENGGYDFTVLAGSAELSEVALYAADVNGDKDINILDLIALKKKQSLT